MEIVFSFLWGTLTGIFLDVTGTGQPFTGCAFGAISVSFKAKLLQLIQLIKTFER